MRRREPIMPDWLFTKQDQKISVDLPHTWNAIDGQDGGNDYYRGTCTYEKTVKCPEYDKEKEAVFLEFLGVNSSAKVVFNGEQVATHDGGYSTFRANVTSLVKNENKILVYVDNSVNNSVYPQKADFTFYGGIYRDVNWLIVSKSHFKLTEYGTPGIHVTPELGSDGKARIGVRTQLHLKEDEDYLISYTILDMEGNPLKQKTVELEPEQNIVNGQFVLENPHLWDGLKDPYLYTMVATLIRETEVLDEVVADFGIRSIKVDPNKGFFLNGKPYPLHGVSKHQDRKAIGNAVSREMLTEDMELIKEVGANCIRLAHYQHDQFFYDLCDRVGMIVWAEIPYISGYLSDGDENTQSQMTELIVQNYNHPSIVTWGLSNEITIDYTKSFGKNIDNHKRLNNLVHQLDPSRPSSIACFAMCTPFHPVTRIPDIIGWNLYLGWYVPGKFLNDAFISFFHLIRPKMPLGYSEYGAEGMPNLHSERPRRGDNTEEYQSLYHEYMLRCFSRHPYMWSTFVWNMFDFAADARNQGGEPGMNHKGLVTFDRKLKKDSFYLYKAWWTNEPMIHICSKRFAYRNKNRIKVKVYSNTSSVKLYADGKEVPLYKHIKGDRVYEYMVDLGDTTVVKAVSGGVQDEAVFHYTTDKHPEYKMVKDSSKNTANWM